MATYPIKMLKDEENKPFVPLVSTDCIRDENNQTLQQVLDKKLSPTNLLAGDYVSITTEGNNCYINVDLPANLDIINNLTTASAGQGALDAYQGKVLKDSIPQVVNDLSSTSTTSALSANQGYVLNQKFNDYAPASSLSNYLPLSGGTVNGIVEILGAASSQPLRVRGIVGSIDTGGSIDDLYIQYKANKRIILGNNGAYNISADGSQYSGNSATATKAIQDGNGNNIIDTYTNDSIMATHDGDYNATYTAGSWNATIMPMNKVKINTNTSLYSLSDNRIKVSKAGNYLCSATMNISNGDNQWSLVLYINGSPTSMIIDNPLGNMANATLANYIVHLNENETITWGYRCSTDNSSIIMRGDRSNFTLVKL